jgi:hypothetical protein
MKDNSFENAMNKIVGQHEAEIKQQARTEKRARIIGRVQSAFLCLLAVGILAALYNYRDQVKDLIIPKHSSILATTATVTTIEIVTNADGEIITNVMTQTAAAQSTPMGKSAAALNAAQQNAATRDAIIDSIAK